MARRKRTSPSITAAEKRAVGLASIDSKLDLGNGNTLAAFNKKIADTQALLDDYNTKLGELDSAQNDLEKAEGELDQMNSTMLSAVGVVYTKDSNEYEKAGGTRASERKRPVRKAKEKTAAGQ